MIEKQSPACADFATQQPSPEDIGLRFNTGYLDKGSIFEYACNRSHTKKKEKEKKRREEKGRDEIWIWDHGSDSETIRVG